LPKRNGILWEGGIMELSRRDFLKASGAGIGGVFLLGALSDGVALASPIKRIPLKKRHNETPTICPYDASGCGFLVDASPDGKVLNIEGDPDHPINRGAACAKGASLRQLSADNPWRLSKVLYRAPNTADWTTVEWDWALDTITRRIKDTRDAAFIEKDKQGNIVNRTEAIACLGGSALDNEECYLLVKLVRALGLVYIEHHARI
jgi:formate dehydrogenase major subunit